ncbi:uncharacterized protein AB9W97_006062 isoform 1-T2 [Spinachia spinachia]
MRPPSRRLSKRGLVLPTIREGAEESLRDLNEANVLHASSEDYLLSICHLASPTFPSRHTSPDSLHPVQLEALNQRLSRLRDPTSEASRTRRPKEIHPNGELVFGNRDPLEHLYGHQEAPSGGVRGAFVPHASTPDLPELHSSTDASAPSRSSSRSETRRESAEDGQRPGPAIKPSLIAQWLSDCRSAWREARVRACMLPAIAEM